MISKLQLTGWRAYDHLDVSFQSGTTFVVARNGVGKTSMLQGASFALFGDRSGYATPRSIRDGHTEAIAEATLRLGSSTAVIRRSLKAKGSATSVTVDGAGVDEAAFDQLMTSAFRADMATLARLTFLPAGALRDYAEERLQLHRHLCRLFGVDQLQAARDDIKTLRTEAKSEVRKVKEIRRSSNADIDAWRSELSQVNADVESLSGEAVQAQGELRAAEAVIEAAEALERHESLVAERSSIIEGIRGQAAALFAADIPSDTDLAALLADADQQASTDAAELERARGRLEGRIEALDSSRHQLDDADSDCPVCLRPLDPATRDRAAAGHAAQIEELQLEVTAIGVELDNLNGRRRGIGALRRAISNLPALPSAPAQTSAEDASAAAARCESLETRIVELDDRVATLKARRTMLQRQLDEEAANAEQHRRAVLAYRREALVDATEVAIEEMIERLIADRIDPLAAKVTGRWKTVFKGSRPLLVLDPSGELKLTRGSTTISFEDMSAGERAVALIVTRLLVLGATAPSPFMWLDEPLEQLDPGNRRLVAQLLTASAGAGVRQLVVTTFEENIARRLEQRVPDVHVQYVTADD